MSAVVSDGADELYYIYIYIYIYVGGTFRVYLVAGLVFVVFLLVFVPGGFLFECTTKG
jgi:hypothetical protein